MKPRELLSILPQRPDAPYGVRRLARCVSVDDLAGVARRRLPAAARAYLEGGGEGEYTLRRNRGAFEELELLPRALHDVSDVETATTILGQPVPVPIALAPVGAPRFIHHEGERAVARAAAAKRLPYGISTVGSVPIRDVAGEADGMLWLQLYLWGDRGAAKDLVDEAAELGYHAVVLTTDVTVRSKRERELHAGLTLPRPKPTLTTAVDVPLHPAWFWHFLTSPLPAFPNVHPAASGLQEGWDLSDLFDGTVSWDDVGWIRERWRGPVVIKGILTAEDAHRAVDAGADAVVVSNHGGRQLDHLPATIDVLPQVVAAVGDRAEVLLDSGIRRGTDILVALALGATAVLIGRAYLYGLAAAGEAGVCHAVDILTDELARAMALAGVRSIDEIDSSLVRRRSRG